MLVLAHMNTRSIFIRWGHCNPTRRNGGHRLHMGFSFQTINSSLEISCWSCWTPCVFSGDKVSYGMMQKEILRIPSLFPSETIQFSWYTHVFHVAAGLLSRSLKKKFWCYWSKQSFATNFKKDRTSLQAFSAPSCIHRFQLVGWSSEKCCLSQYYF